MTINWTTKALRGIRSIPAKQAKALRDDISKLAALPHAGGLAAAGQAVGVDITQLRDVKGGFRVRAGDFRAGLQVEGDTVSVVWVEDRKQAYR